MAEAAFALAIHPDDEVPTRRLVLLERDDTGPRDAVVDAAILYRAGVRRAPLSASAAALLARYGVELSAESRFIDWLLAPEHQEPTLEPEPPEPTEEDFERYREELQRRRRGTPSAVASAYFALRLNRLGLTPSFCAYVALVVAVAAGLLVGLPRLPR
jgi:hypothetical protein